MQRRAWRSRSLLTFAEAAKALGVHRATVYRWVEAGDLRTVTVKRGPSGRQMIQASELRRVLKMGGQTKAELKEELYDTEGQLDAIADVLGDDDLEAEDKVEQLETIVFEDED